MPNQPWWQPIVHHALWLVVMSVVMGWVAKSRLKPRLTLAPGSLVYPTSMLVIGLVCFLLFTTIAVASFLIPGKNSSPIVSLFFAGLALLGLPLVVEYVRVQFAIEPTGLRYQTLLGRRGILPWSQISSIRYSPIAKWFRIDGQNGEVLRLSAMLIGLPEFAQVILQITTQANIDTETYQVLEQTAAGMPPSVWG